MNSVMLYYRASCPHSKLVYNAFTRNEVVFSLRDIATSQEYADELKEITGGNLSVPTVVFPDGNSMIEPSSTACISYLRKNFPDLVKREKHSILSFFTKKRQS